MDILTTKIRSLHFPNYHNHPATRCYISEEQRLNCEYFKPVWVPWLFYSSHPVVFYILLSNFIL